MVPQCLPMHIHPTIYNSCSNVTGVTSFVSLFIFTLLIRSYIILVVYYYHLLSCCCVIMLSFRIPLISLFLILEASAAWNVISRREALSRAGKASGATLMGTTAVGPMAAHAALPDCFQDCLKNCQLIAPKDKEYCISSCREYCDQPDRNDGLSGSISSEGGEKGILGFGTVVKGEDKPPSIPLPGINFSDDKGRKLLGY